MNKRKQLVIIRKLLLLPLCFMIPLFSWAHSSSGNYPISLNQIWQRVLAENPNLKNANLGITAAEGDVMQAVTRPNPSLNLSIENIEGTGPYRKINSAESTLLLNQSIELGGKRFYRMQTAHLKKNVRTLLFNATCAQAFQTTTELFLNVAETNAKLQLANEAVKLNKKTVATIQQRMTAGRGSHLELNSAQIILADQQLLAKTAFQQWESARYALASLWGGQINDVQDVSLKGFNELRLASLSNFINHLPDNPELKALKQQEQVTQSEVSLSRANGYQDISVGIGVRRFNDTRNKAYVAQISMPLPIFNRNQGNTEKALAESRQSVEIWLNKRNELQKQIFTTYQIATQAAQQANTLQRNIIPKAKQALSLARQGYAQGRYSYLDLLNTQQKLLDEQSHYLTALYTYRKAWIALQVLTGGLPKQEMT